MSNCTVDFNHEGNHYEVDFWFDPEDSSVGSCEEFDFQTLTINGEDESDLLEDSYYTDWLIEKLESVRQNRDEI